MRKTWIWAIVIVIVAGAAAVLLGRGHGPAPQTPAQAPAATPAAPSAAGKMETTGNYSGDWMKLCGPLGGKDQENCTARLDAAYGKSDAAPVPAEGKGR
ncbi:MAG: hypothetical protein F8N37_23725 [Telmatospirillum sp.]|nr:hypothetical protein [Telmatospirillum sp.]